MFGATLILENKVEEGKQWLRIVWQINGEKPPFDSMKLLRVATHDCDDLNFPIGIFCKEIGHMHYMNENWDWGICLIGTRYVYNCIDCEIYLELVRLEILMNRDLKAHIYGSIRHSM